MQCPGLRKKQRDTSETSSPSAGRVQLSSGSQEPAPLLPSHLELQAKYPGYGLTTRVLSQRPWSHVAQIRPHHQLITSAFSGPVTDTHPTYHPQPALPESEQRHSGGCQSKGPTPCVKIGLYNATGHQTSPQPAVSALIYVVQFPFRGTVSYCLQ